MLWGGMVTKSAKERVSKFDEQSHYVIENKGSAKRTKPNKPIDGSRGEHIHSPMAFARAKTHDESKRRFVVVTATVGISWKVVEVKPKGV